MKNLHSILLGIVGVACIVCGIDLTLQLGMFRGMYSELVGDYGLIYIFHLIREIFGTIFILSGCTLCICVIPTKKEA